MRDFNPRPYQWLMMRFMLEVQRCAVWCFMGGGKTSATLAVIDALLLAGQVRKVLVLAPLRVAKTTWPEETRKWRQFSGMRIGFLEWTEGEREFLRARNKYLALTKRDLDEKADATKEAKTLALSLRPAACAARLAIVETLDTTTVNYDVLQQLVVILGEQWPWDMVVADESTRLKSYRSKQGGKRTQALAKVAHKNVTRWVNLTGTPSPNGLIDLYGQTWYLDNGFRLGRTFSAFQDRWFGFQRAADAANPSKFYVNRVVFPHAQEEIQDLLRDICLTLDPKDWFDLEAPIASTVYVDLPPKARKHYNEMQKEMFTAFEGHEVEAFGAAAKTIKCLQIANGAAYVGESNEEWVEVHDEKLQALGSIVEEAAGAPVLVAYHFKSDLSRLLAAFPGGRTLDADPNTISQWNNGEIPLLFAHPASAGHGLNLQDGGNILVYFGHNWNLEERQQIAERIGPVRQKQAGHNRPVFIYNIVARNTVDELVIERIETKRSVQAILLDAMKRIEHAVL